MPTVSLCLYVISSSIYIPPVFGINQITPVVQASLADQAQRHASSTAREVASAVEQKLLLVGSSITMVSTRQAALLLLQSSANGDLTSALQTPPMLRNGTSFMEYNFAAGCVASQTCPSDYGALCGRSPFTDCSVLGSMQSSSVYAYSGATQCAVKSGTKIFPRRDE